MKKIILHLCADLGSDSRPYQLDESYEVIRVGESVGVQNYAPPENVHGVIANPVCTEFQTINGYGKVNDSEKGMFLVNHCLRIIKECSPKWWALENPARGELKKFIGKPNHVYQPWQYGSPWTKSTGLWGDFNIPEKTHSRWSDVEQNPDLYIRPGRGKPNLAFLHKSALQYIEEWQFAKDHVKNDADFRSLCSQGFAEAFKKANP